MQEANETHPTVQTAGYSPYLLWLIWILWLPFLYPALVELFQAHPAAPLLIAYLAGITLFIAVYMWATLRNARQLLAPSPPAASTPVTAWDPLAVLMVLCLLLTPGYGRDWFDVFILTSACAAGCLRPRQAAPVIAALALLVALILALRLNDANLFDIGQTAIFVIAVGVNSLISWEEFRSLCGKFSLFHIAVQRRAGNPKSSANFWGGMTLISKHPPGQCYFSVGLELSWSSADAPPHSGCR